LTTILGVTGHHPLDKARAGGAGRRASCRAYYNRANRPALWDGKAAERIVDVLERFPLEEPAVARSR